MTAPELTAKLVLLFPDFAADWNSTTNLFREDDGGSTLCGVFAAFSNFVRDRFTTLSAPALDSLGQFLEYCLSGSDSELDTAAATCFLENISSETFTRELASHFGTEARSFLARFEHNAP